MSQARHLPAMNAETRRTQFSSRAKQEELRVAKLNLEKKKGQGTLHHSVSKEVILLKKKMSDS